MLEHGYQVAAKFVLPTGYYSEEAQKSLRIRQYGGKTQSTFL